MSRQMLSSTGCRLARCQASPAVYFVHQYRRTLMTTSAPSTTTSFPRSCDAHSPVTTFLIPSATPHSTRRHHLPLRIPGLSAWRRDARVSRFSTTAPNKATTVALNPRLDDDGKQMMVEISPRAAKRLRHITNPSSKTTSLPNGDPYDHLRVTVSSGGCHGFQYLMSLDPVSKIDKEEDTIFEADAEGSESQSSGETNEGGEAKVVMDSASLEILQGSTVDYTVELIGSQFKIVDNPRASSNCGCGTSFDVK